MPVAGEGISVSTLSVETSSSASSAVTRSPTFFSQRVTVPSVTDSPSAGIVTIVPEDVATAAGAGAVTTGAAGATGATGAAVAAGATGAAGAAATGALDAAGPSAITASSAPTATV